jgi:hypothetical protein
MSTRQQRREARRLNPQPSSGTGDRFLSPVNSSPVRNPESQFVLGETREEFAQLQSECYHHHKPRNPEERFQVDALIRNEWLIRRYFRVEAQLWEYHTMQAERGTGVELGEAFTKASTIFMRLERKVRAAEKAHKEARSQLERLKQLPQPQETKAETQQLGSFLTTPSAPRSLLTVGAPETSLEAPI